MKILIIDDERSIRNSLKEILADEGYDVDVAENGRQGCEMVEKEKYVVMEVLGSYSETCPKGIKNLKLAKLRHVP